MRERLRPDPSRKLKLDSDRLFVRLFNAMIFMDVLVLSFGDRFPICFGLLFSRLQASFLMFLFGFLDLLFLSRGFFLLLFPPSSLTVETFLFDLSRTLLDPFLELGMPSMTVMLNRWLARQFAPGNTLDDRKSYIPLIIGTD